jgi:hypothetical protein
MSDEPIFNENSQDIIIGTPTSRIRHIEIRKSGTTTWFNSAEAPIVIISQAGTITNLGNTTTAGIVSGSAGVFVANMTSASVLTGPVGCTTLTATTSVQAPLGIFASLAAPFKMFDIRHPDPTKENQRLRHGSLEGPELAVYIRGKTTDNTIVLPDYWQHLIDVTTTTVHLTATTPEQELHVIDVNEKEVTVGGNQNSLYHYHIVAERKDVPKLEIEIDSHHDYGF